jgi:hypothetical protein
MPNIVSDASDKLVQVTGNELKVLSDADLDAVTGGVTYYNYNEEFGQGLSVLRQGARSLTERDVAYP